MSTRRAGYSPQGPACSLLSTNRRKKGVLLGSRCASCFSARPFERRTKLSARVLLHNLPTMGRTTWNLTSFKGRRQQVVIRWAVAPRTSAAGAIRQAGEAKTVPC